MKSSRHNGIASALGAALLFGASTPLAKLAVSSASPVLIAGLLYLGSGVGLAVLRMIHTATGARQTETPLAGKDLPWLAGAILAGGVAGPTLLLLGLLRTPASAASLLLNLEAVATAAIAWVVFREASSCASVPRCRRARTRRRLAAGALPITSRLKRPSRCSITSWVPQIRSPV
jgi:drug/metabolite transporter (DMT)-like permease